MHPPAQAPLRLLCFVQTRRHGRMASAFSIDHVSVPVPTAVFPARLARVTEEGNGVSVLAGQLCKVVPPRDAEGLDGRFASSEIRHRLVLLGDLSALATRCKLSESLPPALPHARPWPSST